MSSAGGGPHSGGDQVGRGALDGAVSPRLYPALSRMRWRVGNDKEIDNGCSAGGIIHLGCFSAGGQGPRCVMSGGVVEMGVFASSFPNDDDDDDEDDDDDDDDPAGAFGTPGSYSATYTHRAARRLGGSDGPSEQGVEARPEGWPADSVRNRPCPRRQHGRCLSHSRTTLACSPEKT